MSPSKRGRTRAPAERIAGAALIAAALTACGGAPRPDANEAFARIQVEEARIENAYGSDPGDCDSIAAACPVIDEASAAICEIAGELDDADARTRCERARSRATQCRTLEVGMCSMGAAP